MCCMKCCDVVSLQQLKHLVYEDGINLVRIHFIAPYPQLKQVVDKVFLHHRNREIISKDVSVIAVNELPNIKNRQLQQLYYHQYDIIVKNQLMGICGSDKSFYRGALPPKTAEFR